MVDPRATPTAQAAALHLRPLPGSDAALANGILQQMIQPIAFGAALGIHPLAVLIVTIAGGSLFGMIGLVLAAPLTSAATHISTDLARARATKTE